MYSLTHSSHVVVVDVDVSYEELKTSRFGLMLILSIILSHILWLSHTAALSLWLSHLP